MANTNRTFLEIQTAIREDMTMNPGLISDTERRQFINDCIDDLGTLDAFEKDDIAIMSVAGVVTLPDDFVSLVSVVWVDGRVLPALGYPQSGFSSGMTPIGYVPYVDKVRLYPTPETDAEARITYRYRPAHLVNDTDRPDIPNGWDSLIVDFAIAKCHRKNGEIGLYREYMSAYEDGKQKLDLELIRKLNSKIIRIVDVDAVQVDPFPYTLI